ncbi:dihydrofolate synthase / folylpolyglutamate synthase [Clostridium cavendishii DSM 21758]|uniref:tetrahydrofolate synthase n=1 Tax=Clostridium cavendishii DSM 21758 TaxID=1121302 RepID=A0A1M6L0B7_9CLOT|nr:folylpolyglutamate synthase/dihydrofolate synthase family protein [Clostridium cavendishii]SHJ64579.1 dihydrofolate synthase / folylpolyglutamate synthase [Clostridium cavendishii DSM 21758]
MNYNEAIKYIHNTAKFGMNFGLERTEKILELLGNPHKELRCIHIAGTNGKGSTTAMITSVLKEAGYSVGMYTSPFLEEFEERIQINFCNIDKDELASVITKVSEAVNKVIELGYDSPTEFEIITCAMFYYFNLKNVDFAVIEVGLGGRLDSTNVLTPLLTVIASISLDHMNILGDTIAKIASEKAGIIKGGIVVSYPQVEEAREVIREKVRITNSSLIEVDKESVKLINAKSAGFKQEVDITFEDNNIKVKLPLLGKHQLLNTAVAIRSVYELKKLGVNITNEAIKSGIENVRWKGRLEVLKDKPVVAIDGAHNLDGIKKLKESVLEYFDYKNLVLIIGMLGDKEVYKMVDEISTLACRVIVTEPHSYRAENPVKLYDIIRDKGISCEIVENYEDAYKKSLAYVDKDDMILITGSLYMIGDMRKIITRIEA